MRDVILRSLFLCCGGNYRLENRRKIESNKVVSFIPNGDYYYQKALRALEKDQVNEAYKYIKRAFDLSPEDPFILLQYGVMLMDTGDYDQAYELIHTAYHLDQDEPEIVFMLAEVSGCMGMLHDAKKYASKYLEMAPDGMYSFEAMDIIDFTEQERMPIPETTDGDSEKLVAQEKARRLMESGEFTGAIEVLEQLIEKYPDTWAAYNNLALAYFYIGEAEQAKALLNHIMRETNKGNLHAICNLTVVAYYEKDDDALQGYLEMLSKIQPYDWENRYKLGATLALIGQYELAYKWLHSMKRKGYEGDPGFYFWLAQSAYFTGHEDAAKSAWKSLLQLDPSKEGYEPWAGNESKHASMENNREFIIEKINSQYVSDRMYGFYLLKSSPHKQEIIAHPKWIDMELYTDIEKLSLAYALGHQFNEKVHAEKYFVRGMLVADEVAQYYEGVRFEAIHVLQLYFALFELALQNNYPFKNVKAIAAAVDYMFHSALDLKATKKDAATKYGVSVATLTKYCDELIEFVPTMLDEE